MSDITLAELAQIEHFAKAWQFVGRMAVMEPADVLRLCDMARQVGELRAAARDLLATLDKHATASFGEAEDALRELVDDGRGE